MTSPPAVLSSNVPCPSHGFRAWAYLDKILAQGRALRLLETVGKFNIHEEHLLYRYRSPAGLTLIPPSSRALVVTSNDAGLAVPDWPLPTAR